VSLFALACNGVSTRIVRSSLVVNDVDGVASRTFVPLMQSDAREL
jgi:hypothetical protein